MTQAEKTGARIARLRNERGLTQQQLAQQLGVTNKAVSKWETGAGLPDVSVMAPLARELGVTVDELLAGERQPRQRQEARGVMTALRTGGARAALAQSTTPFWMRLLGGSAAALCTGCAVLLPTLFPGPKGWALAACLAVLALFCGADAVWCFSRRAAIGRTWRGDASPTLIQVDETGCRWNRDGYSAWFPHAALRRIDRWKNGFVLLWAGGCAFVEQTDETWVALAASKSGAAYRSRRTYRAPVAVAAGMLFCALLGWKASDLVEWARWYQSAENNQTVQTETSGNAAQAPRFSGSEPFQYAVTDEGVWFTTDGGETMISPSVCGAQLKSAEDFVCGLASETALGAVYSDGACSYSVSASCDGGTRWNSAFLAELCRPAVWGTLQFPTGEFGYVALGTDFSMGTGKETRAWFTADGGVSWQPYENLPQWDAQNLLCGFCALPDGAAVMSLTTANEENWPLVYGTGGDGRWTQLELPWEAVPVAYLHGTASLEKDGEAYVLTLTQQPFGTETAVFRAPSMEGPWALE